MRSKKRVLFIGIFILSLICACKNNEKYEKEVEILPKKSFYKVIINHDPEPLIFHVKIRTDNDELFDFNVIDSISFSNYKVSHEPSDLIFLNKIHDQKKLDTNIQIPKGKVLFGFENFANDHAVKFRIEIITLGK